MNQGQAIALSCPSCGAGLGPMEGSQYRCAYCGHLSLPPRPQVDVTQREALLASILTQFESRRAGAMGMREAVKKRQYEAMASTRRTNGYVLMGIGALFSVIGIVAAVLLTTASMRVSAASAPAAARHHGKTTVSPPVVSAAPPVGAYVFALGWFAGAGAMFYGGVRYGRADRRDKRLREKGIRGRAVVRSYKESNLVVDGNVKFSLVLEVDLPGRAPYVVRQSDYVFHPWSVTNGADLPVFVDPGNPSDVMVDWFTLAT